MKREEGYYWILNDTFGDIKWEIAYWNPKEQEWYRVGIDAWYRDGHFKQINETRLMPPTI